MPSNIVSKNTTITQLVNNNNRDSLPKLDSSITREIINGNNNFALNIYKKIINTKDYINKNHIISPYSIATAFAMLYLGSAGKTEKEISEIFSWKGNTADFHQSFFTLSKAIQGNTKNENFELYLNNQLWLDKNKNLNLLETYKKESQAYYNQQVDMLNFSDTTSAKKVINTWVNEKTKGKIPFLYENDFPNNLISLLVNSIYFNGKWDKPFDIERTKKNLFITIEGKDEEKDFMYQNFRNNEIFYIVDKDFKAIKLPYADKKTSLLVLLPNQDYATFVNNLDINKLNTIYQKKANSYSTLEVQLPKWKTEGEYSLYKYFKDLGFSSINKLDLSKMIGTKNLAINNIIHKTFIEVDENKTVAAAVTSISATLSINPQFIANKPFLYFIINEENIKNQAHSNTTILFMGQVVK